MTALDSSELPGLAFSRPKNKFVLFFKLVGFEVFDNLLTSLPFKSIQVYNSKIQNFSFFKTEFGIFQLQAPGNPV